MKKLFITKQINHPEVSPFEKRGARGDLSAAGLNPYN